MGFMYKLLVELKWYTEFRNFQKNVSQSCILKEEPDVKMHLWNEFGHQSLKNAKCMEILPPNRQWMVDYKMEYFREKYCPFETILSLRNLG